MEIQSMELVEKEVENILYQCIEFNIEENYIAMGQQFAKVLTLLQEYRLISPALQVITDPEQCLTETRILLESLQEAQRRHASRRKLLTHRHILNVWLRKNQYFQREVLPGFF